MRVLIACEFSGIVRDAFAARGHDAWSRDLLPRERPGQHIQGDCRLGLLGKGWDLLIAHPPCTYLCNSGVRWLYGKNKRNGGPPELKRWQEMRLAREFFMALWQAPVARICIENPIPHKYAQLPNYSQLIQPYEHGHGEIKRTAFWLRGLPLLKPSNIVEGRTPRVHRASPGPDRWKERSRTLQGIADAMAEQWGQ